MSTPPIVSAAVLSICLTVGATADARMTDSGPATAADPSAEAPAAAPPADPPAGDTMEEIIVLGERVGATKLDVPIRDLPQSIVSVPRALLEDREIVRLEELADAVVGLRPTLPFIGGVSLGFFVRGFNGAPVLVDGVNAGVTSGATATIQNLTVAERIEVLRGPASVLYGQANPGGVINIVLKRPEPGFGWRVDGTVDSHGARRANADVTGGLGLDGLSGRLIASLEESETFRDFGIVERRALAPQIAWEIGERTRLDIRYTYDDYTFNADRGFGFDGTALALALPPERNLAEPTLLPNTAITHTLRANLSHTLDEAWTVSIDTAFYRSETKEAEQIDFGVAPPGSTAIPRFLTIYGDANDNSQQDWTISGSLQGDVDLFGLRHRVFASAEHVRSRFNFAGIFGDIPPIDALGPVYSPVPLRLAVSEAFEGAGESRTTAVYLQDLISVGEQWKVLLGGRYDLVDTFFYADAERTDRTTSQDDNVFTPRGGLVWQPTEATSLFYSYSRSFLPQIFTDRLGRTFDPEEGTSHEIGIKQETFGGRGSVTATIYRLRRSGTVIEDPNDIDALVDAGSGRSRGFELEFELRPSDAWTLSGGIAYTDAAVVESDVAERGETLPGAAPWTATLFGKYGLEAAGLPELSIIGGLSYAASTPWVLPNRAPDLPAFVKLDLGLEYRFGDGFELQGTVENLLDDRIVLANGFGLTGPGAPRTFLLTLAWNGGSLR